MILPAIIAHALTIVNRKCNLRVTLRFGHMCGGQDLSLGGPKRLRQPFARPASGGAI